MDRLLQTFDVPYIDRDGETYDMLLFGRSRPGDTWQGWLVFSRRSDGKQFATETETTQPTAEAVLYWATGLENTYFEGAFERARRPKHDRSSAVITPPPLRDVRAADRYLQRLTALEQSILHAFRRRAAARISTKALLDELPHTHADVIRALEDLEKQRHLLVRRTEGGSDWLVLTQEGARTAGICTTADEKASVAE